MEILLGICLRSKQRGWRDGSVVKSTDCSSRGPEFNSQQPHGGSQPCVMGSDALFWCVWRQLHCTHINKSLKRKKKALWSKHRMLWAIGLYFIFQAAKTLGVICLQKFGWTSFYHWRKQRTSHSMQWWSLGWAAAECRWHLSVLK